MACDDLFVPHLRWLQDGGGSRVAFNLVGIHAGPNRFAWYIEGTFSLGGNGSLESERTTQAFSDRMTGQQEFAIDRVDPVWLSLPTEGAPVYGPLQIFNATTNQPVSRFSQFECFANNLIVVQSDWDASMALLHLGPDLP